MQAWSWRRSIQLEPGRKGHGIEFTAIECGRISRDGIVIGLLGTAKVTQHQIRPDQLRPLFDSATLAGKPFGKPADHTLDHLGLLLGSGVDAVIAGDIQPLLRRRQPGFIALCQRDRPLPEPCRFLITLHAHQFCRQIEAGAYMAGIGRGSSTQQFHRRLGPFLPRSTRLEQQRFGQVRLQVGGRAREIDHSAIGVGRVCKAAQFDICGRDHAPAAHIVRCAGQPRLDPGNGVIHIHGLRHHVGAFSQRARGQIGAAQQGIKTKGQSGNGNQTNGQYRATQFAFLAGLGLVARTQHFPGQLAPGSNGLFGVQLAAGLVDVDPGKDLAELVVGIGHFRLSRVDRAPTRRVKQRGAGDGGNSNGDRPENHEPQTLDCQARQGTDIYKPNTAKNHQNRVSSQRRIATGTGRRGRFGRMSQAEFDFAVFGSTPLAHLLAGLLAGAHGRTVVHIGESAAGYRLPRGIDLSVAPVTRPDTWSILTDTLPETLKLISQIAGRGGWGRVDPIYFADDEAAREALSHIGHMAAGFGLAIEPTAPSLLGGGRNGITIRDAIRLNRPLLEPALDRWLTRSGVTRATPDAVTIQVDGRTELQSGETALVARQAILADDESIARWLPMRQWPKLLHRQHSASVLTTPTRSLASPLMVELDSGVTLLQQPEGGIAAFGQGRLASFSAHVQALLGHDRQVEQAGQTTFVALHTSDGGPAVGRVDGTGADVVAGMGSFGAFIVPALARWLAGKASTEENTWFGARLANRSGTAGPASEFAAPLEGIAS